MALHDDLRIAEQENATIRAELALRRAGVQVQLESLPVDDESWAVLVTGSDGLSMHLVLPQGELTWERIEYTPSGVALPPIDLNVRARVASSALAVAALRGLCDAATDRGAFIALECINNEAATDDDFEAAEAARSRLDELGELALDTLRSWAEDPWKNPEATIAGVLAFDASEEVLMEHEMRRQRQEMLDDS